LPPRSTTTTRGLAKSRYSPEYAPYCELLITDGKKACLTQQAFARRLRRPRSFVAKIEAGERRLDIVEFFGVCMRSVSPSGLRITDGGRSLIDGKFDTACSAPQP
jgi:hypothetical protein